MMEVPQLHGFGPAANRLLQTYKMLLKVNLFKIPLHTIVISSFLVTLDHKFLNRL